MSKPANAEFQILKKLHDDVWLAKRNSDGEEFVARKISEFDRYIRAKKRGGPIDTNLKHEEGMGELFFTCNQAVALSALLNHEHIISIAGTIRQLPLKGLESDAEQYIVWDYCDAGNLENLFQDTTIPVRMDGYLPESLCWHVLKAVMRALLWLHSGERLFCDEGGNREWRKVDEGIHRWS
jgi:hypothetical protein